MKYLSIQTFQCGITVQGLTTLAGTTYLTGITNTASWDHVIVGTTAQGQIYTRTYAQFMTDVATGIGLSGYVPTSRTLSINGVTYDLTANRSWTITTPYVSKLQHSVKAGVAINKGQAVYVTSADGTNMIVGLASNASEATSSKTMGLLDATVTTNGFANVVTEGLLSGLDTSTAGTEGDPVWLGTGGNLIYGLTNKPYAPAHLVFIGIVTRKNANNGEIFVKVQNGFELDELHDVDLKTNLPTAGQLLRYNSDGLWKNWSPNYLTAESDTLATVTSRGATTSTPVTFNGNVTLGNSADLIFQDLAGTFPTSGKGFDWTLNNDGARIYAMQPSSDSIDLVFQLRDNATTNDRFVFWVDEWQGPAYDKYPLIISGGTEFDLKDSSLYTNTVLRLSNSGVLQNVTGNISMFTNNVGYLTSYTETDTLATVTGRGATTTSAVTVGTSLSITGPNRTVSMTSSSNYLHIQAYAGSANGAQLWLGNDNDPGFYVNANQHFFRGLDSSNKMYIDGTSGNVGIGTTSPSAKLHVAGGEIRVDAGQAVTLDIANSMYLVGASNQLRLYNGGNPVVNITTGGNVGIGTTNPAEKLSVNGTFSSNSLWTVSAAISFWGGYPTAYGGLTWDTGQATVYATSGNKLYLASNGSSPDMTIDTSGNVGIGTITPVSKLHVLLNGNTSGGPTGNVASFQNSSAGNSAYISLFGAYNAEAGIIFTDESEQYKGKIGYDNISEYMYFQTDGSEKARITSTGNVGIGVTNPSYKLDVNGSFNFVTSGVYLTYNSGVLYHGNYYQFPSGSYYYLYGRTGMGLIFGSNNAEVGRFDLSGNLGIGTTSPGYKLEVNGIIKSGIAGNSSANYAALVVASAGTTTSQAAIAIQQLTSEGDTIIFGDYEPYVEYNFMHENASNVFHIHSGENTNSLGSNTFYNRSGNPRTGYIKWSLYQGNGDMHVGGSVGIGNTSPSTKLDVSGVITATGGNSTNWNTAYGWGNHSSAGYVPQARTLTINGTSYDLSANRSWTIATTTPGGSDTQVQYNSSGSLAGASALTYNSTTNRVGINQASPGYDLDVNGQVRVQDKLRIGTGNGVVHMSSSATINASATTVVWAQTVSVGMCAFIEYYILNNNSLTDQRAGTIMVTWNQSGTPTIAHTETTTPDIGSTTSINFTSSLVGSDARINAVNSSANPYTIVMSYKYF
jgi:hypothetical protein